MFIFYALFLMGFFAFLHWIKFCCCCFRQGFFFTWELKKWSLVMLDSNSWTGICFGRLSIGCFTEVTVLNRFDCNALS